MPKISDAEKKRRLSLYKQGLSPKEIGKLTGVQTQSIRKWLDRHGVRVVQPPKKYTSEELLEIIRNRAEELGRPPFITEMGDYHSAIYRFFGSWSKAVELAGLPLETKVYTGEELLEIIRNRAEELGRAPTFEEMGDYRFRILYRFKQYKTALKLAGMGAESFPSYTDEELLEVLKGKADELGRAPLTTELPQSDTIAERFGGWNSALTKIGLDSTHKITTLSDWVEIAEAKAKELGRTLTPADFENYLEILLAAGSWNNLLRKAGLEELSKDVLIPDKEEFLQIYIDYANSLNRVPQHSEMLQKGMMGLAEKYFGYLKILRKIANDDPRLKIEDRRFRQKKPKYSVDQLIDIYVDIYKKHGRLTVTKLNELTREGNLPSGKTFRINLGIKSHNDIWDFIESRIKK